MDILSFNISLFFNYLQLLLLWLIYIFNDCRLIFSIHVSLLLFSFPFLWHSWLLLFFLFLAYLRLLCLSFSWLLIFFISTSSISTSCLSYYLLPLLSSYSTVIKHIYLHLSSLFSSFTLHLYSCLSLFILYLLMLSFSSSILLCFLSLMVFSSNCNVHPFFSSLLYSLLSLPFPFLCSYLLIWSTYSDSLHLISFPSHVQT